MSGNVFQMIRNMDRDELKTCIAVHCGPLLAGIKISNLLIVPSQRKEEVLRIFGQTRISCYVLWESEEKTAIFLYIRRKVTEYLKESGVKYLMDRLGYGNMGLDEILECIGRRYGAYMEEKSSFPHEIGLLLGYPAEDVEGFMVHHGKNFLCSGYWKVYGNPAEAEKIFRAYDMAQEAAVAMVKQGKNIRQIVESSNFLNCASFEGKIQN